MYQHQDEELLDLQPLVIDMNWIFGSLWTCQKVNFLLKWFLLKGNSLIFGVVTSSWFYVCGCFTWRSMCWESASWSHISLRDVLSTEVQYILYKHTVDERDRAKHLGFTTTPKISKNDCLPGFLKDQESVRLCDPISKRWETKTVVGFSLKHNDQERKLTWGW